MSIIEIHTRQTGMRHRMLTEMATVINSGEEYIIAGTSSYIKAQKIQLDLLLYDCECNYTPLIDSGRSRGHIKTWDGWNVVPDTNKITGFTFYKK